MININRIYKLANEFGFDIEEKFGDIYIKTSYENWRFHPTCGKVTLFHQGHCSGLHQDYHKEFTEYISADQLMNYIKEHEQGKYTAQFVEFTVFKPKRKGYKNKKMAFAV